MLDNSEAMVMKAMMGQCDPDPRILYQAKWSSEDKGKKQTSQAGTKNIAHLSSP